MKLLAFALGYVLGARAGRERYHQMMGAVRELAGSDLVRQLRADVLGAAQDATRAATLTPPVIVGPGPGGTARSQQVDLPDVEPSTAVSGAPSAEPEAGRAKRLDPP